MTSVRGAFFLSRAGQEVLLTRVSFLLLQNVLREKSMFSSPLPQEPINRSVLVNFGVWLPMPLFSTLISMHIF